MRIFFADYIDEPLLAYLKQVSRTAHLPRAALACVPTQDSTPAGQHPFPALPCEPGRFSSPLTGGGAQLACDATEATRSPRIDVVPVKDAALQAFFIQQEL